MNDGKFKLALVKISNGEAIPEDEPIHIFRARDKYALDALKIYLEISRESGCNDYHEKGVMDQISRFEKWRDEHPEKMKIPGITRGV
jgi:hypothetical protein